ncbi:MAG: hypothetical protein AAGI23_14595 [Bacteroidota bacterium]
MIRLALLTILAFPILLFGQSNEWTKRLKWSPTYSIAEDFQLQRVIPSNDGFYMVRADRQKGSPVFIDTYDKQLNLQHQIGFDPANRGDAWQFERLVRLRDTFYLFSTELLEKNLKHTLYYESILSDSINFRLDQQVALETIKMPMRNQSGDFEVIVDQEETHCLIVTHHPTELNKKVIKTTLLGKGQQTIWEKTIKLPYPADHLDIRDKQIDQAGNLFILARHYRKGRVSRRKGVPNYHYVLLQYAPQSTISTVYTLDANNQLITDLQFRLLGDGEVVAAGLVSNAKRMETDGTCYFRIDLRQQKVIQQTVSNITAGQNTNMPSAQAVGDTEVPKYITIDHLFIRSDGGVLLIAERSFQVSKYTYQDDDILLVNLDKDGDPEWATRIPKKQSSYYTEDVRLSYYPIVVEDEVFLVYNDDGRNFTYSKNRKRLQHHKSVKGFSTLTVVRADGSWKAFPIAQNSIENLALNPNACRQIGSKTLLLYAANGKKYRLGKLQLE